ncbi:MAG TPA: PAS domain S-box protein [Acidimicrobiales bacterium]|nr:PAS domain S-box protein [Acidimicrobiales bacterium]
MAGLVVRAVTTSLEPVNVPATPDDKLVRLLRAIPDTVLVLSAEGDVLWGNTRAEQMFGRTVGDSIGLSALNFVHPDDLELVSRSLETIQNKSVGTDLEIRVMTTSGWRLMEVIGAPVAWFEKGSILFSLRDLTERRRFEVASNQTAMFRSLVQNAAAITMLISPTGHVMSVSGALARILGHDPELVEHEPLHDLVADEDRAILATAMSEAMRGATSAHPTVVEVRLRRHGSAEVVPFELTIVDLVEDPTVGGLVVTAHDVAEKKHAEKELLTTLSLLKATLNSTADGLLVVDRHGKVSSFNHRFAEMWHVSDDLLSNGDDQELISFVLDQLADPESFVAKIDELYNHPVKESTDTIHFKDGRVFERFSRPQFVEADVVGRVWSFRDVTETYETQRRLAESNRRFEALIKGSGDLFALTDPAGVITFVDGSVGDVFGLDPGSMIGTNVFDLLQEGDLAIARDRWDQVLATRSAMPPTDYWIVTRAGTLMCISLLVTNCLDDPNLKALVVNARDVTQSKLLEEARRALIGASAALVHATSEEQLYEQICGVVVDVAAYEMAWVGIVDNGHPLGVRMAASAGSDEYVDALEQVAREQTHQCELTGIFTGDHLHVIQSVSLLDACPCRTLTLEFGYDSVIGLPFNFSGPEFGVLAIYSRRPHVFTRDAVRVLSELARELAYGIDGLRTRAQRVAYQNRFESSLEATVEAIATASELRDPYNGGHQHRVAELATAIAQVMGLDPEVTTGIGVAASIHDIGKLVVPAELLSRPGRLTQAEFALVKEHSQAGHDIVSGIAFPWPVAEVILEHHERLDGSGYPRGLQGDAISIETRIVSVSDVVEAMQSHRPYRPGLGLDAALEEIMRGRRTLFDPDVVDACVNLFREGGFTFASAS